MFLEQRALALENATPAMSTSNKVKEPPATTMKAVEDPPAISRTCCLLCKSEQHKLFNCVRFKLMPVSERLKFVADQRLCKICLNKHTKACNITACYMRII